MRMPLSRRSLIQRVLGRFLYKAVLKGFTSTSRPRTTWNKRLRTPPLSKSIGQHPTTKPTKAVTTLMAVQMMVQETKPTTAQETKPITAQETKPTTVQRILQTPSNRPTTPPTWASFGWTCSVVNPVRTSLRLMI